MPPLFSKESVRRWPTWQKVLVGLLIALVVVQVIAYLVGFWYEPAKEIKVAGYGFALLIYGAAAVSAVAIVTKLLMRSPISRQDIILMLLVGAAAVAMSMFLPDLVPSIFELSMLDLKTTLQAMIVP